MQVEAKRADVWGAEGVEDGWCLSVSFSGSEVEALLNKFEPTNSLSPGVADSRPVLRTMLNTILAELDKELSE